MINNTQRGIKTDGFQNRKFGGLPNLEFWCSSNFGTRLGGSLAPEWVSKLIVLKMASSGDILKTRNFGAPPILVPVWVFPK